jgi:hypothetical protein
MAFVFTIALGMSCPEVPENVFPEQRRERHHGGTKLRSRTSRNVLMLLNMMKQSRSLAKYRRSCFGLKVTRKTHELFGFMSCTCGRTLNGVHSLSNMNKRRRIHNHRQRIWMCICMREREKCILLRPISNGPCTHDFPVCMISNSHRS